jgi:hypothetical protein
MQKSIISLSKTDIKNAETSRILAKNLLSTWKINSGFIRGALGDRINKMPAEIVKAMDELDKISEKTEWNDFELGYSLGVRARLLGELIINCLKIYAPDVLKYIPLAL